MKIRLVLAALALALAPVFAVAESTIDPTIPAANSPFSSEKMRRNFNAAVNDINALQSGLTTAQNDIIALRATPGMNFVPTGTGDQTTALTAFVNTVYTLYPNGGVIQLPPGVIYLCNFTIRTGMSLRGAGDGVTKLTMSPSCNGAVLKTDQFDTLTGSTTCAGYQGPGNWSIESLSVHGNPGSNTAGYGLRAYGWAFTIKDVTFWEAQTANIYTEFNDQPCGDNPQIPYRVEANMTNVGAYKSAGNNIMWNGPHDSQWLNVIAGYHGGIGMWIMQNGFGLQAVNVHPWTGRAGSTYNFVAQAPNVWVTNGEGDGGIVDSWLILGGGFQLYGGSTYSYPNLTSGACFKIGGTFNGVTYSPSAYDIVTRTSGCYGAGGTVNFANDGGSGRVSMVSGQGAPGVNGPSGVGPNGSWYTGTPSSTTAISVVLSGGAGCEPNGPAGCPGFTYNVGGNWRDYTPTLTWSGSSLTNTVTARYKAVDQKTYVVNLNLVVTSGTASGSVSFSVPPSAAPRQVSVCSAINGTTGATAYATVGSGVISLFPTGGFIASNYFVTCTYEVS